MKPRFRDRFRFRSGNFPLQNGIYHSKIGISRGVLAQLVERLNGIEEVRGSNPLGSIFFFDRAGSVHHRLANNGDLSPYMVCLEHVSIAQVASARIDSFRLRLRKPACSSQGSRTQDTEHRNQGQTE